MEGSIVIGAATQTTAIITITTTTTTTTIPSEQTETHQNHCIPRTTPSNILGIYLYETLVTV
jgi:hypothetical protein